MIDWVVSVLVLMGCMFCLVAAIGIVKLPDTLIRMHAATKAGTLGTGLIIIAVAVCFADTGTILRAMLVIVFLYMTAPVAAHLIGRAAYRSGIQLFSRTWVDELQPQTCDRKPCPPDRSESE